MPAFSKAGPRYFAMSVSCSCANITMLGVFFGFRGSFSTVIASIVIPSERIPSMYFTKYFANAP